MLKKILFYFILIFLISLLVSFIWRLDYTPKEKTIWGITFSQTYTEYLKLDWKKTYEAIISDLHPKKLRLVAYWEKIESKKGNYDFKDLDFQVQKAKQNKIDVVLAVGYRMPRWPECHTPDWANKQSDTDFENSLDTYMQAVVKHYKGEDIIKEWQVENEPFLSVFGNCKNISIDQLKKRIALVKSIDPARPVMTTDSGELSLWIKVRNVPDIFGSTLYRVVWNKNLGWFEHIYPPAYYTLRSYFLRNFSNTKKVVISELQAEPWGSENRGIGDIPFDEQVQHFSTEQLKNNMQFAVKTGINEIYLWGPEWWYYRKINGDDGFWKTGKEMMAK